MLAVFIQKRRESEKINKYVMERTKYYLPDLGIESGETEGRGCQLYLSILL